MCAGYLATDSSQRLRHRFAIILSDYLNAKEPDILFSQSLRVQLKVNGGLA